MRCTTLQDSRNVWVAFAACVFLFVGIYRFPVPPGQLRVAMQFLFEIATALGLAAFLFIRISRWIGAFLVLVVISHFYPWYGPASYLALNGIFYPLVWLTLVVVMAKEESTKALLDMMGVLALAHFGYQCVQYAGLDMLYAQTSSENVVGFMANPNEASSLLAFCLPVFLRKRWRWGLPLMALGLIMTKTSSGALSAAVGILAYLALIGKLKYALAVASVGPLYIAFVDAPGIERWPVWKTAFLFWTDRPFFGIGLGNWKILSGYFPWPAHWDMVHNQFLQGLVEMGVCFGIICLGYFGSVILRVWRLGDLSETLKLTLTALMIVCVNAFVNYTISIQILAGLAVTWLAILEICLRGDRRYAG